MTELKFRKEDPVKIFVDNKTAIALAKHLIFHGRSKHIDTQISKFHL